MLPHIVLLLSLSAAPILSESRLVTDVIPKHYQVELKINAAASPITLSGKVCIKILCEANDDLSKVKLHSKTKYGLRISNDTIRLENFADANPTMHNEGGDIKTFYERDDDILVINFRNPLKSKSVYNLCLDYEGTISEDNGYIIRRDISDIYIIATNSKRQIAFPCFDEPNFRATFKVEITEVTSRGTSFANTERFKGGAWFAPPAPVDPLLPATYELQKEFPPSQISFVMTNIRLASINQKVSPQWNAILKFIPLEIYFKSIEKLASEFNTYRAKYQFLPEALPNVQLVALPTNEELYSSNWGLSIISERELFEDPTSLKLYNIFQKFTGAVFGGLISPDRWDSEWLYEALAKYVALKQLPGISQTVIMKNIPMVAMWTKLSANVDTNVVEGIDGLQDVKTGNIKGLMLLRMIDSYIGEDNFMKAVTEFVRTFQYSSASPDQLWKIFDKQPKPQITKNEWKEIIMSWTEKSSYPLVSIELDGDKKYTMKQEPFVGSFKKRLDQDFKTSNQDNCWFIPVPYFFHDGKKKELSTIQWAKWLDCNNKEKTFTQAMQMDSLVLILNANCLGMYRVKYGEKMWPMVLNTLKTNRKAVTPLSRAQIVHDTFSLAWLGYSDYGKAFSLFSFLKDEVDDYVWSAFFDAAFNLDEILTDSQRNYGIFQMYLNETLNNPFFKKYTRYFNIESNYEMTDFDSTFYHWACYVARNEECRKQALDQVEKWMKEGMYKNTQRSVKEYQRIIKAAFCTVLSREGKDRSKEVNFLINLLSHDDKYPAWRKEYIDALQCIVDENTAKRFFYWATSATSGIATKEEKQEAFLSLAKGKYSFKPALDYTYNHFDDKSLFFNNEEFMAEVISVLTPRMKPGQLKQMETFIDSKLKFSKQRILKEFQEKKAAATRRAKWLEINEQNIQSVFSSTFCVGRSTCF